MKDNTERDTSKAIDRLSTLSSEASGRTFNLIDKAAKKASDFSENRQIEKESKKDVEEQESRLKTSENAVKNESEAIVNEGADENVFSSKLKTNVAAEKNVNTTNINAGSTEGVNSDDATPKTSKLKTVVDKAGKKVFKFNENQGKVSKVATVVGKSGEKLSKAGGKIVRTSRELNKAMSEDGSGTDYIKEKINRKIKTKTSKKAKKVASKATKKLRQTLGRKLVQVAKAVIVKLLKLLVSLFAALAEFIIPIALVVILLLALGSIFGASSSDSTLTSYKNYMNSIQEEYDKKVDKFMQDNPDGIIIGVKGSYGKIDWRIPLSIMQGTMANLSLDQTEKDLIQKFKDADLLEKHEIVDQVVEETDSDGNTIEKTKKVLIITNGMYGDYMDWCKNNYSIIADFNKKKKVSDGNDTYFSSEQIEVIEMLYQSDSFVELLGDDFKTRTPSFGGTTSKANLNSANYNSKNVLATSGFKGQCTWYSHGRALELFNVKLPSGNAQTWLTTAISMGFETGTQPSYNSVVVLAGRKFGHVAFVEHYEGGEITISEGNVGNPCSNDDSCSQVEYANEHANELVRTKTYKSFDEYRRASKNSGLTIVGFIYLN